MSLKKHLRTAIAGLVLAAVPVSSTLAAVRPNAAIPAAGSTAVTAQEVYGDTRAFPWLPIGIIIATLALAIYIAVDKGGDGEGSLSRG